MAKKKSAAAPAVALADGTVEGRVLREFDYGDATHKVDTVIAVAKAHVDELAAIGAIDTHPDAVAFAKAQAAEAAAPADDADAALEADDSDDEA